MIYLYHHTDNDGYGAAAVVLYNMYIRNITTGWFNNKEVKLIPYDYEKINTFLPYPDNDFADGDTVYIVDLSVSEHTYNKFVDMCNYLAERNTHLIWIDHHKSSINNHFYNALCKLFETLQFEHYINTEFCATFNAWYYLIRDKSLSTAFNVPEIIRLIDDYDCWKLKLNETKPFHYGFGIYCENQPSNPNWYKWLHNRKSCLDMIRDTINNGTAILSWLNTDDSVQFNNYSWETTLCGYSCCVLNRKRNSDLFKNKVYDIYLSYIFDGTSYTYSIYSEKSYIMCNVIAEMFGGGGHINASGFSTKKLIVQKPNLIYKIKDKLRQYKYDWKV